MAAAHAAHHMKAYEGILRVPLYNGKNPKVKFLN